METKYWSKVKEFQGVQLLRDPETMQCRILPIERPQPQQKPEPVISPEMERKAEEAYQSYMLTKNKPVMPVVQPQPLTFEEQIKHDWQYSPSIRAEFISLASYEAYCRAVRDGRAKVCGRG